ncbi:hypothetical protein ABB37_07196 [Leptomonas pyrrhocoris]|uniref:Uncharacterized protein n=1 Tax=Leptomonas pyrrhocoris TaxID=157538 RepID=A0A0M9FWD1_LEPPY|nr:hypothetical protein ABB37_07196 [Leptomonas pyrrhocoris]KPA77307.1 hypothetical protein ABB37_07196 [Leptomonas pyrrhocoris]|eukprot:XP_015655746.1 hypothetical protein ABB37_07196 [Leptomonas pyrrhocoris]
MWQRYAPPQRLRVRCFLLLILFLLSHNAKDDIVVLAPRFGGVWWVPGQKTASPSATHAVASHATNSSGGGFPRVLFAAAAVLSTASQQANTPTSRIYPPEKTKFSYDADLKPTMLPWRALRLTLRQAGCFTTRALPRLTDLPDAVASSGGGRAETALVNRTDPAVSPLTLRAVCRRPIVLVSGRSRGCVSCNHFANEVLSRYAAEWAFIHAHVTVVDAGDPMTEQLVRYPYPLWYDAEALEKELVLTPHFNASAAAANCTKRDEARTQFANVDGRRDGAVGEGSAVCSPHAEQLAEAAADHALFTASLRQKAALLVKAPVAQAGHQWSHLVQHTFANPNEYVLRIIFMYPHNGSVMRDVVNEGIFDGSSPDYLHFYTSATHFFSAVKKAVRVMDWLEHFGDY